MFIEINYVPNKGRRVWILFGDLLFSFAIMF